MTARLLVVDACCLLNLLATGRAVELAVGLDSVLLVTPHARAETLFLSGPPDPDDEEQRPTRVPVDLEPLLHAGRLRVHPFGDEIADAFVVCAALLRDADASSVALAVTLRVPLASDDGKVRRVAKQLHPELVVLSTLELVREAAERARIEGAALRALLLDLCTRGNFAPPRRDPARAWFEAASR